MLIASVLTSCYFTMLFYSQQNLDKKEVPDRFRIINKEMEGNEEA